MRPLRLLALGVVLACIAFEALSVRTAEAQARAPASGCTGDCTFTSVTASGLYAGTISSESGIFPASSRSASSYYVMGDGSDTFVNSLSNAVWVRIANSTVAKFGPVGSVQQTTTGTLPTCTAGLEGTQVLVTGTGGTRTKRCLCTTDGTTPAWVNGAGTVGTSTSC